MATRRAEFWIVSEPGKRGVKEINGSCIHEEGSIDGHIGDKDDLILLTQLVPTRALF